MKSSRHDTTRKFLRLSRMVLPRTVLGIVCLSFFVGCSARHSSVPAELPTGLSLERVVTINIEPVRVTADIEHWHYRKLCNPMQHSWPDVQRPSDVTFRNCGGVDRVTKVPGPSESLPVLEKWIVVGEKRLEILHPDSLRAQLVTALSTVSGLQIESVTDTGSKRMKQESLRLQATLTELSEETEGGDSSFGISGLPIISIFSVLYSVANPDTTSKGIHVRFDVEIIDPSTNQIVAAFPATGSYWGSYVSRTFFRGSQSEPYSFFRQMNESAATSAIYSIPALLVEALKGA